MTGGGWGGCVVALTDPGAVDPSDVRLGVVRPTECRGDGSPRSVTPRDREKQRPVNGCRCCEDRCSYEVPFTRAGTWSICQEF